MVPLPLVIVIPVPCVKVLSAYPDPLPIRSCPLLAEEPLSPVPPREVASCASDASNPPDTVTTPLVERLEKVIAPDALMVVALAIAPVLVMPAELLLIPLLAVITPAEVIVPVPVVAM